MRKEADIESFDASHLRLYCAGFVSGTCWETSSIAFPLSNPGAIVTRPFGSPLSP